MKIQIKDCKQCMFFNDGNDGHSVRHNCAHPKIGFKDLDVYRSAWDGWNAVGGSPVWCPLKVESLNIEFSKVGR